MSAVEDNPLGRYLKERRARLDPAALGLPLARRRTPGLRREEVAQRAHVSPTWYTWLEQGRGGAPSTEVLERLAGALQLSAVEREHLFLLAQNRPPEVRYQVATDVPPRLQRVLDALEHCPSMIRTPTWDVVAWNRACAAVLNDYAAMPPDRRNILRHIFANPAARGRMPNWAQDARFVVAAFRADAARAGAMAAMQALVSELSAANAEFAAMWAELDVRGSYGEAAKQIEHPVAGPISLEYSGFAVEGRPDLTLIVYHPATPADEARVRQLMDQ
ncbi:helix-turn-helix transcriptional regulator [Roseateles cellulosilyticus]|uniref:Helix-turn-helix transcriptional regulator n=1 Tax=Pelomonas cellulosilytica TaxID=2906762 RepID=A0ABS8Y150_9BURK|nr:helix-turn-helix transcriptional regulator [Pelomonas sp. P8]MCE4556641.1 helix-turn-helix transcriptional regulator [Pelomonas sp. P8]